MAAIGSGDIGLLSFEVVVVFLFFLSTEVRTALPGLTDDLASDALGVVAAAGDIDTGAARLLVDVGMGVAGGNDDVITSDAAVTVSIGIVVAAVVVAAATTTDGAVSAREDPQPCPPLMTPCKGSLWAETQRSVSKHAAMNCRRGTGQRAKQKASVRCASMTICCRRALEIP